MVIQVYLPDPVTMAEWPKGVRPRLKFDYKSFLGLDFTRQGYLFRKQLFCCGYLTILSVYLSIPCL